MPLRRDCSRLELADVFSHRSPVAFFEVEVHTLPLGKGLKPGPIDGRIVHEYVTALFPFNKTIPLLFAKPLHDSFCQSPDLLSKNAQSSLSLQQGHCSGKGIDTSEQDRRTQVIIVNTLVHDFYGGQEKTAHFLVLFPRSATYSTVTLFARFLGISMSLFRRLPQ